MKIIVVEDNVDLLQEMMFMLQHYGHSVRGRVGTGSPLLDWLPRTWPERRESGGA